MSKLIKIASKISSDHQNISDDYILLKQNSLPTSRKGRSTRYTIGVITILLLISLFIALYFFINQQNSTNDESFRTSDTAVEHILINHQRIIIDSNFDYSASQDSYPQIQEVIVADQRLTSFNTTPFPKMKILRIDDNVKLENLVINNSHLTQFVYSSKELKHLWLINNTKMTIFKNSNLPALTNLQVHSTHITQFNNNRLHNLTIVKFADSNIQSLQLTDTGVKVLIMQNCGQIDTHIKSFNQYQKLSSLAIANCTFKYVTFVEQMPTLKAAVFFDNIFSKCLVIRFCDNLSRLEIESPRMESLILQNLPNLFQFEPQISTVYDIRINNTNISQFKIKTDSLKVLSLVGNSPKKIQDNIPDLVQIVIQDNPMTDAEFSNIKAPNLTTLYLVQCNNIKLLNNSFPQLVFLILYSLEIDSISNLIAPKLKQIDFDSCKIDIADTVYFGSLRLLEIVNTSMKKLIIQSPIQTFFIGRIVKQPQIIFNSSNLISISAQECTNLSIKNNNFQNLKLFDIRMCENLEVVNNTFTNTLQKFRIDQAMGNFNLENNTFLFNIDTDRNFIIEQSAPLSVKQKFTQINSLNLFKDQLTDFQNLMKYSSDVRKLDVSNNLFSRISQIQNKNITELSLEKSLQLLDFSNNKFESLVNLSFEKCNHMNVFKNNTLPKLEQLNLRGCIGMRQPDILKQFENLFDRGTNLKYLIINQRDSQFLAKVKEIWNDISILTL